MASGWAGVTGFDSGPACTKPKILNCATNSQGIRIGIIGACPASTHAASFCFAEYIPLRYVESLRHLYVIFL